jgi:hypothetical protein
MGNIEERSNSARAWLISMQMERLMQASKRQRGNEGADQPKAIRDRTCSSTARRSWLIANLAPYQTPGYLLIESSAVSD